jgi:hypothetical protein
MKILSEPHSRKNNQQVNQYYRKRQQRSLTMIVKEEGLKKRIQEVADKDGRSVNSWLRHHILPVIEERLDAAEKQGKKAR